MIVHTGQDTYRTDKVMEEEYGVSSLQLMEVAGKNVADQIICDFHNHPQKVMIVTGPGNNGGDGFVTARFLMAAGWEVTIVPIYSLHPSSSSSYTNACIIQKLCSQQTTSRFLPAFQLHEMTRFAVKEFLQKQQGILVDALFGVGLSRPLEGCLPELVHWINESVILKYAIDIPSGICSETGIIMGRDSAIKATKTITFQTPKIGHLLYPGKEYTGVLCITHLGIPSFVSEANCRIHTHLSPSSLKSFIKQRPPSSHKGTFGRVYTFAGSKEYPGALSLSLLGTTHSGAGLLTACYKENMTSLLSPHILPQATHLSIPVNDGIYTAASFRYIKKKIVEKNILCIGSGLGREPDTQEFCRAIHLDMPNTVVVDADGLWALRDQVSTLPVGPRIYTPHLGEMSYLTNLSIEDIQKDLVSIAQEFSCKWNATVVLKSSTTVIAQPTGEVFINAFSSSALSQGGSGDILAGTIAGFLAQSYSPLLASILAVVLHSLAGQEMEKQETAICSAIPHLLAYYPRVLQRMME